MENLKLIKKDIYYILLTTLLLIGGCVVTGYSLVYGFFTSIFITALILHKSGFSFAELYKMVIEGIIECKTLYLLIILIGATVSIWLSSGIVPTMIYYGFEYMQRMNFLFSAFVITSVMSVFMGTAVGTISTIGIALMGVGRGFGIPDGVLLGTIVSGAFIADKISPISGLLNLTMTTTKTRYRKVLQSMLVTFIPVYLISAAAYFLIGRVYSIDIDPRNFLNYQQAIFEGFYVSPWLMLLPLGVVCLSILGVKTIKTITFGLLGGMVISGTLQNMDLVDILHAIYYGYRGTTASTELNSILISGGIRSMLEVLFIVLGAVSLSSLIEKTGLVKPLMHRVISPTKSKGSLVFKTGMISGILTIVTCDQTVGIILPGRLLREKYAELGHGQELLVRTISDTGTIIAPLFPWNVNALIIGMITGISAVAYAPYAILCYIFPVVSILMSHQFTAKKGQEISTH